MSKTFFDKDEKTTVSNLDWVWIGDPATGTYKKVKKENLLKEVIDGQQGGYFAYPTLGAAEKALDDSNLSDQDAVKVTNDPAANFDFATTDVDTGTDRITESNHGLSEWDKVTFTTTGTLPAGLSTGTDYYVLNPTTNDFQVASSVGGSAIDLTDTGSGTHTLDHENENGYYHVEGSSIVKDSTLYATNLDPADTSEAVTGKAVDGYTQSELEKLSVADTLIDNSSLSDYWTADSILSFVEYKNHNAVELDSANSLDNYPSDYIDLDELHLKSSTLYLSVNADLKSPNIALEILDDTKSRISISTFQSVDGQSTIISETVPSNAKFARVHLRKTDSTGRCVFYNIVLTDLEPIPNVTDVVYQQNKQKSDLVDRVLVNKDTEGNFDYRKALCYTEKNISIFESETFDNGSTDYAKYEDDGYNGNVKIGGSNTVVTINKKVPLYELSVDEGDTLYLGVRIRSGENNGKLLAVCRDSSDSNIGNIVSKESSDGYVNIELPIQTDTEKVLIQISKEQAIDTNDTVFDNLVLRDTSFDGDFIETINDGQGIEEKTIYSLLDMTIYRGDSFDDGSSTGDYVEEEDGNVYFEFNGEKNKEINKRIRLSDFGISAGDTIYFGIHQNSENGAREGRFLYVFRDSLDNDLSSLVSSTDDGRLKFTETVPTDAEFLFIQIWKQSQDPNGTPYDVPVRYEDFVLRKSDFDYNAKTIHVEKAKNHNLPSQRVSDLLNYRQIGLKGVGNFTVENKKENPSAFDDYELVGSSKIPKREPITLDTKSVEEVTSGTVNVDFPYRLRFIDDEGYVWLGEKDRGKEKDIYNGSHQFKLYKTADPTTDVSTWTQVTTFNAPISGGTQLDDGSIVICTGSANDGSNIYPAIYRSTDKSTFTKVHTFSSMYDAPFDGWGMFSDYGKYVLAPVYGLKGSGGVKVHLSTDFGATWSTIFDASNNLSLLGISDTSGWHVHGGCIDPHNERIWVCHGDSTSGLLWSDDWGNSWNYRETNGDMPELGTFKIQFCAMYPMRNRVLCGTDMSPSGVFTINRSESGNGGYTDYGFHKLKSGGGYSLSWVPSNLNQPNGDHPCYIPFGNWQGDSVTNQLYATYDGVNFRKIFDEGLANDATSYQRPNILVDTDKNIAYFDPAVNNGGTYTYRIYKFKLPEWR